MYYDYELQHFIPFSLYVVLCDISDTHMQGTKSIRIALKSCLHDVYLLAPLIIHLTRFYNLKIILLFESPPRKTKAYLK
jgi:hypothetical protein